MNSGQAEDYNQTTLDEQRHSRRLTHDLRASLAITNGFSQALETSFSELCDTFEQLLLTQEIQTPADVELIQRVEQLESDCRFCLSRINRSLTQLGTRMDDDSRLRSYRRCSSGTDSV